MARGPSSWPRRSALRLGENLRIARTATWELMSLALVVLARSTCIGLAGYSQLPGAWGTVLTTAVVWAFVRLSLALSFGDGVSDHSGVARLAWVGSLFTAVFVTGIGLIVRGGSFSSGPLIDAFADGLGWALCIAPGLVVAYSQRWASNGPMRQSGDTA